jgi:hypothetical protein
MLRHAISSHMEVNSIKIFKLQNANPADIEAMKLCAQKMRVNGEYAGEEALITAAHYLERDIHVFKYTTIATASPHIYASPVVSGNLPIALAFYEPGHYRAVFNAPCTFSSEPHTAGPAACDLQAASTHHRVSNPGNGPDPAHQ